jgi:membrane associated rhomboid family serine protease
MGIYDREYYRGETRGSGWFSGAAPVCRTLILINVVVFLVEQFQLVDPQFVAEWLSASSDGIFRHGRVWQLLTATFLHSGPIHLVVNMLFLWVVGREMEAMYGPRDFLALYLSAAVVSTLGWAVCDFLSPPPHTRMVGASGAVLAVVVLYALYYPRREVMFMFIIPVEMWLLVVAFIGYQVFLLLRGGNWQTAVESHLSGAAYGYLFKRFDLRWSRMPWNQVKRPRFRVIAPESREVSAPRTSTVGPSWTSEPASIAKPAATAVLPEEQLDARLDDLLAKIARVGRAGLTDEDNRVLQEASQRARNRRSERL